MVEFVDVVAIKVEEVVVLKLMVVDTTAAVVVITSVVLDAGMVLVDAPIVLSGLFRSYGLSLEGIQKQETGIRNKKNIFMNEILTQRSF